MSAEFNGDLEVEIMSLQDKSLREIGKKDYSKICEGEKNMELCLNCTMYGSGICIYKGEEIC